MVSPRGALLFVAKLFTLLFNKCAARASDETEDEDTMEHSENPLAMCEEEDSLEDNEAAVNGIDDSGESQESHSPSPSFCLCNTMALCCWLATESRRVNGMPWYLNCLAYVKSFDNESSTGFSAALIAYDSLARSSIKHLRKLSMSYRRRYLAQISSMQ